MSGLIVFGQALYEASEFAEARQVFERALALDPENLIALRSLGDMSLQSGDMTQARAWYTRLLDADPKDTSVIALVSEIDASVEAAPIPAPELSIDTDAGDQPIPFIADATGAPVEPGAPPSPAVVAEASDPSVQAAPTAPSSAVVSQAAATAASREPEPGPAAEPHAPTTPPLGLERHYPVDAQAAEPSAQPASAQPAPFEDEIPLGAEGLRSAMSATPRGAEALRSLLRPTPATGTEGLKGKAPGEAPAGTEGLKGRARPAAREGTEGLQGKPVPSALERNASQAEEQTPLDTWPAPAEAKDDRLSAASSGEPFVNETMAQLYLQQGYRQLALKVYYQLAEARPNDQGLKDRISEIEAADRAAHPDAVGDARRAAPAPRPEAARPEAPRSEAARPEAPPQARREAPPEERPAPPPSAPRSPSIESPTPGGAPESEESPSFDRTPIDSPPSQPSRQRESIESPAREEPRAEPEGIAARQPSIKEFFATLGRRRPPRAGASSGGVSMRPTASMPSEPAPAMSTSGPAPSLDTVFAGATVDPADSRAASRLAGAFSGATGTTSRTPPTPPTPTPRVNPRLPQAQESEEDVAKFRAWLDGLTGE